MVLKWTQDILGRDSGGASTVLDMVISKIIHTECMTTFQMTCACGDAMKVESTTREQAVSQLKTMMNESAIAAHMKEKHAGEPMIPVSQVHAIIEKTLIAV